MLKREEAMHLAEIARLIPDCNGNRLAQDETGEDNFALSEAMRIAEALLFAAAEPLAEQDIEKRLPRGAAVATVLEQLRAAYSSRGVNLVRVGGKWMFRTAADLAWLLAGGESEPKKLSRAALETLAIIAYHQPVTRAEIEDIRGVVISKGTLDVLLETGWIRLRGRRRAPGRPITYGTTQAFLVEFSLDAITDLPGLEELKGAGLFEGRLPTSFAVPQPSDAADLTADEDPLTEEPLDDSSTEDAAAPDPGGPGPESPDLETPASEEDEPPLAGSAD